jgi:hypothetical protein
MQDLLAVLVALLVELRGQREAGPGVLDNCLTIATILSDLISHSQVCIPGQRRKRGGLA